MCQNVIFVMDIRVEVRSAPTRGSVSVTLLQSVRPFCREMHLLSPTRSDRGGLEGRVY